MARHNFDLKLVLVLVLFGRTGIIAGLEDGPQDSGPEVKPNIILFLADDLGYGDLGCYGHPTSTTPNVDQLAQDGLLLTQFYSAASICAPSRASLMTGRHQMTVGVYPGVFAPDSTGGLPLEETTIAEILDPEGYDTYMVGKWHLGYGENGKYIPTNQGFDHYFGIPYSHDQCPCPVCSYPDRPCLEPDMTTAMCNDLFVACPILDDDVIVQQPADFTTLTRQYTSKAIEWIRQSVEGGNPFFLYFAFNHPHFPQYAGKTFTNTSKRGIYGDSLSEMDSAVGDVMAVLEDLGITDNTLTFFSSDNGPDIGHRSLGGSAGSLKCGKFTTYEGGMRVPFIANWPGRINPGRSADLGSTLDLLPTIANVAGAKIPDVKLDGYDMSGLLFDNSESLRQHIFYFSLFPVQETVPMAVRFKQYKAHYFTVGFPSPWDEGIEDDCTTPNLREWNPPLLYDLELDPEERYNLNQEEWASDVLLGIEEVKEALVANLTWAESEILKGEDPAVQPCCNPACTVEDPEFPTCCECLPDSNNES